MESQPAMQTWFLSAERHHWDLWDRGSPGTQLHCPQAMKLRQPAILPQTHPRSTGSKLPPFTCFSFFFSTTKIAEKTAILKCHKCIRKKNAFIYFFLSFRDLTVLNVSSKILSGLWEMELASECLMMLREDKLTLDHWKKRENKQQHKFGLHELICEVTLSSVPALCWTSSMWSCIISLSSHLVNVPVLHRSPHVSVKHAVALLCQCDLSCSLLMLGLCCCQHSHA